MKPTKSGYSKKIICLANSRKPGGRCVAGREIKSGKFSDWIRPVSARASEEISLEERRYSNGEDPKVLDIIHIQFNAPNPHGHQTENHVIDANSYWVRNKVSTWTEVQNAIEIFSGPLWVNGYSTNNGLNDRVPDSVAKKLTRSLYLIKPTKLIIIVALEGAGFPNPRRKVRATFKHNKQEYKFIVTDPVIETKYLAKSDGTYPIDEAILCISLGEVHSDNYAYKLIAAVITPADGGAE